MKVPFFRGRKRRPPLENAEVPKKKRRAGRPTREEAAEKRRQKLANLQTEIKLVQLERQRQRLLKGEDEPNSISLEKLKTLNSQLRPLGLAVGPLERVEGDGFGAVLKALLQSPAAPALVAALASGLAPRPPFQPAPQMAGPIPQVTTVVQEPVPVQPQGDVQQPDLSAGIINLLSDKSPAQAAQVFWGAARADAERIARARDVSELLGQLRRNQPQLSGLADWLEARPEWLAALQTELRRLAEAEECCSEC